ncbi:hypothetical protein F4820DRAFT_463726 [Hypoxylon rubiginosum]|uniref:Uncharacterized protein n=1 Tax=Hypoxylon rubiginosum TaxID=110542 RepID=A0ACB9YTJ5_9PEZI|nr:hypothetical protein F4820DRAFT_463726 [Hypoxylon rubiginosum]
MSSEQSPGGLLRKRRLLQDIKELVEEPYPNITIYVHDDRLSEVCLILTTTRYKALHLTVKFPSSYPIDPPIIKMNSSVVHPNVFRDYICATILRRGDQYTPAYTLKGIAIQMLSFFSSDRVEQDYGEDAINLDTYGARKAGTHNEYQCLKCHFGDPGYHQSRGFQHDFFDERLENHPHRLATLENATEEASSIRNIDCLPDEILLEIISRLDFNQLTNFAAAWDRISNIIRDYDIVRQRELQCFCLKKDYRSVKLGVGVSVDRGQFASEFDLLSKEAFDHWNIRHSVNNLRFEHWLPLPIAHPHWRRVKGDVASSLQGMATFVQGGKFGSAQVIFAFMNDVVVRLNKVAEGHQSYESRISNLRHASEKAIDSYFHLFHLLVCLATEDPSLVKKANALLQQFMSGKRSKTDCPNLGHLLIALLISDVEVTEDLMKSIITEAITRNVVWLFDKRGANMPELSYMEPGPVSAYRLDKTFQGSRTSHRLLMFSELFRRTARPSHQKPLSEVRDELFVRHGAPPPGAAQELAATVRRLHTIDNFPAFLKEMGLFKIPDPRTFTGILRKTVHDSMTRGYSTWGMPRTYALLLRTRKEDQGQVQMTKEDALWLEQNNFFPGHNKGGYRGK